MAQWESAWPACTRSWVQLPVLPAPPQKEQIKKGRVEAPLGVLGMLSISSLMRVFPEAHPFPTVVPAALVCMFSKQEFQGPCKVTAATGCSYLLLFWCLPTSTPSCSRPSPTSSTHCFQHQLAEPKGGHLLWYCLTGSK